MELKKEKSMKRRAALRGFAVLVLSFFIISCENAVFEQSYRREDDGLLVYLLSEDDHTANIIGHECDGIKKNDGNVEIPSEYEGYEVTGIGYGAFEGCTGLASLTIPSSVQNIGVRAFCGCSGLTEITIHDGVGRIDDWAFGYCTGLTGIIIPASIQMIDNSAFSGCVNLRSVTIGEGILEMGSYVFESCDNIVSYTFEAHEPPFLGQRVFHGVEGYEIQVPNDCVDEYKKLWAEYEGRIRSSGN